MPRQSKIFLLTIGEVLALRGEKMNDYAIGIYKDMKPVDRVLLYMLKVRELSDLREAMGEEDFSMIRELCRQFKEEK